MLTMFTSDIIRKQTNRLTTYLAVAVLVASSLVPLIYAGQVDAAQLTSRSVTISTSQASATGVTYNFGFTLPTTVDVQGIIFEFCTNPLGACTLPTGMVVNGATYGTETGWVGVSDPFAIYAGVDAGACDDHNSGAGSTEVCVERTDTTNETAGARTLRLDTITNPSTTSIDDLYVRVTTYNDTAYASADHNGTVAAAVVDQLTVTGRIQERLQFCVASVADDAAADTTVNALTNVAGCVALTDTTVDIGVIDNSTVSLAPVNAGGSTLGDDELGIAMINTNASGGTNLTFFAEPVVAGSSAAVGETDQLRSFRVNGSTIDCNASAATFTDQCFQSASAAGTTVNPANEWFGMYVPCVDTDEGVVATAMTVDSDFDGSDNDTTNADDCENEDKDDIDANGSQVLAWNDTSTAATVATSAGVLDDAVVKLSFGAAAAATTPTGTYTVVTTFIATPTF